MTDTVHYPDTDTIEIKNTRLTTSPPLTQPMVLEDHHDPTDLTEALQDLWHQIAKHPEIELAALTLTTDQEADTPFEIVLAHPETEEPAVLALSHGAFVEGIGPKQLEMTFQRALDAASPATND